MKKSLTILTLFSLISLSAQAQKTATWKGGTPGRTTDWNCATNWKEGRVPDEFSNVIIPDVSTSTFSFPVITKGNVEIASILCAPSAKLTTQGNARLIVLDAQNNNKSMENKSLAEMGSVSDSLKKRKN